MATAESRPVFVVFISVSLERAVAQSWLLRSIGPARAGFIMDATSVYNAGWDRMRFDEAVPGYHVAGAALVVGRLHLANGPNSATT